MALLLLLLLAAVVCGSSGVRRRVREMLRWMGLLGMGCCWCRRLPGCRLRMLGAD
jgi:hypothetical protein